MQEYAYKIHGEPVKVRVPQDSFDLEAFKRWFMNANNKGPVALDTETTGLDIYSPGYRLRTVQFGDPFTAWVIHWERGGAFAEYAARALQHGNRFQIHNAPFDWAVLDRHGRVPGFTATIEHLAPRTIDTRLKAGLIDPRQPQEGGRGTALKPLSAYYIDPTAPDTQGDLTAVFRSLKLTKATGWAGIPLDHPTYNLYAGLDVLLTSRLDAKLDAELKRLEVRPRLVQYEHEIARICAVMQRKGMLLDAEYTRELDGALAAEAEEFEAKARRFGVTNVNAPAQLREALKGMGEVWEDGETTGSGALKVDKAVLHRFADLDRNSGEPLGTRTPNPLALAIIRSKRAGKWRSAYTSTFLETMDRDGAELFATAAERRPPVAGRRFVHADSNGNAAGSSTEDAILQGFLELVERDAVALWWYNRVRRPGVDLHAAADPWTEELIEVHRGLGRQVWALDLTSDLGIPVFAALSRRTDKAAEDIVFGFGAQPAGRRNLLWMLFVDPAMRELFVDWPAQAPAMLSTFRRDFASASGAPDITELVDELERVAPEFKAWWREHDVHGACMGVRSLRLPAGPSRP